MRQNDLGDASVGRFGTMPGSWQDPQINRECAFEFPDRDLGFRKAFFEVHRA